MEVGSKKFTDKNRCRELAMSSSFCRRIYSEVEEVGWEHLLKMGEDLTFLRFCIMDNKRRAHILEITLDKTYPRSQPSVSADVPYNSDLEWSPNSRLRDIVQQFQRHVDKLQDFWSTLDDIDRSLLVLDPKHSHHAVSYRPIKIGNDCCMVLSINVDDPRSLPECRFLGSDTAVNVLRDIWKRKWREKNHFLKIFCIYLAICYHNLRISNRMRSRLNAAFVMLNIFQQMMNLEPRVGLQLIILAKMETAIEHSTVFVLVIGSAPSRLRDSHLMFCLGTALTVQIPLQSN
ncbi:uncharacterized protein LOC131001811 isoform X2 [Salvia miltiorrhiza]|uniref:uncharacterized protein LOC131001811 isoform X2 n=1 Tax=Salvia miltiorrhiza TaxID=226208 RepID=UPI0025AD5155|nr:uncharacterized protein LOC131001811 isoform X2 [Salvia miltiorrhiza]